jgi:hypothetical protein
MAAKRFTADQLALLNMLGVDPECRQHAYEVYLEVRKAGYVTKDFRGYLRDCVRRMWQASRRASQPVYLGD